MEYTYLFGSKLLQLDNAHDEDWITFIDKKASELKGNMQKSISFCTTRLNQFMTGNNQPNDRYKALCLYQLSAPFINDPAYPFNFFNILDHKRVWKEHLKNYINQEKIEALALSDEMLPKIFYHLLYQYYMITEDVHFISSAAKAKVQAIHDRKVPSSYFYDLRDLINSL